MLTPFACIESSVSGEPRRSTKRSKRHICSGYACHHSPGPITSPLFIHLNTSDAVSLPIWAHSLNAVAVSTEAIYAVNTQGVIASTLITVIQIDVTLPPDLDLDLNHTATERVTNNLQTLVRTHSAYSGSTNAAEGVSGVGLEDSLHGTFRSRIALAIELR